MEKELDISEFYIQPNTLQRAGRAFFEDTASFFHYSFPGKVDFLYQKTNARLYDWLDAVAGGESLILCNEMHRKIKPFLKMLGYLKKQNIVSRFVLKNRRYNDAPHMYRLVIYPSYVDGTTDGHILNRNFGSSSDTDLTVVFSKAIGEFLERYFLTVYKRDRLVRASLEELHERKKPVLDLSALVTFSRAQQEENPHFRWDKDSVLYWDTVRRFGSNKEFLVPAQLIYWNYIRGEGEPCLQEPNTNGAGGMFTKEGAILSGLYELIQRDGFLIFWLNKLSPPQVDPETIDNDDFQILYQRLRRYGFKIFCVNITTDIGVPSFAVAVVDESGKGPRLALGAGCHAEPTKALSFGLKEAYSVYTWLRTQKPYVLPTGYRPLADRRLGRAGRLRFWADPSNTDHYGFFISGKKQALLKYSFGIPSAFSSEAEELNCLVKKVESAGYGYEVYYRYINHRLLSRLGYNVVKVLVPQLVPLYLNENRAPLAAPRLKNTAQKLGYNSPREFNPWPHPFP
jgi:ribosomal protein S12 methylthiotransferase accessory factor